MQPRRQHILQDIGIVRWRLRDEAAVASPPASTAVEPQPAQVQPAAALRPWSLLSIAASGVVLLVDGESTRRDLRLALDVVGAASGDWQTSPASRRFDWPPGGALAQAEDGGRRALTAFVDKDLSDHQATILICAEAHAQLLDTLPAGCRQVRMPPLTVLGRDAAAKRALWQSIRELRR